MRSFKLAAMVAASLVTSTAFAGPVAPGFTGSTVGACDDCFSAAVPLAFTLNYFGTNYSSLFISNNGYLTFNSGQSTYTPGGLGAGYSGQPIIAAFFADVDTRGAGTVDYGTGTYNGFSTFGVTWNGVGYYSGHNDKLNTFQILLSDRSDIATGDFDIYFNYNQIQWETGDVSGGSAGLGGTSAAAGFNAGNGNGPGTYYEIAGSRVPGSFLDSNANGLIDQSNDGVAGQYLFQVRAGQVTQPPSSDVPEPASWAMFIGGFGLVGSAMRRKKAVVSFG